MADESVREYMENNSVLLEDIRGTLIQSNTRLESVVDILTVQSNTLAEQMRVNRLARENEELKLAESEREASRIQEASGRMERSAARPNTTGALDTPTRGGLLRSLVTAGLLAALGTAAYKYFGLDGFKDDLANNEAYDEFKQSVGEKFDSLIFGEQTEGGDRVGGLMGAIEANPVGAAAAGAGLVSFLMNGARFRALPSAMAAFMLGYIGLNAFFNPEANEEVAASIDDGIKYLEDNFGTEIFNILRDNYGINIDGEGTVNVLQAAAIYKGTSLAMRLFGARGRGKFLIPLAGAMAAFAFNYFGLDEFFEPDDEDELFDFLESETLSEYGDLIAAALGMGVVAFGPGMATALAVGAASKGKSRAPKGSKSLVNRLFSRLPGGGKGALIAFAASIIAAYTYNRLGLGEMFAGDDEQIDSDLDDAVQDKLGLLMDSAAMGAGAALALGAARTPLPQKGYIFDKKAQRYRVAPGSRGAGGQKPGTFASIDDAKRSALSKYPRLNSLLSKVPGLSAAFAAGSAYYIISDDTLSTTQKVAMVTGEFAGLTISALGAAAGALIGGPFAPLTGFIGGLAGYISGEYLVTSLMLWVLDAENQINSQPAIDAVTKKQLGFAPGSQAIGEVSSSRLPGMQGNVAPGMEYNALDAMSDTSYLYSGGDQPVLGDYDSYPTGTFSDTFIPQNSTSQATPQDSVVSSIELTPREAVEQYLGRPISDLEFNYLIRAVYAESSAQTGGEYTVEKGMIMGSILNRARTQYQNHPDGSIIGALVAKNQFQAVTGTSANGRQPSSMFMEGPGIKSQTDIAQAAIDILPKVSKTQKDFTAAATGAYGEGTNIGYRDNMLRGGGVTLGGTVFRTAPEEVSSLELPSSKPTVTSSAMQLGSMSGSINVPVTTVINNVDNSQNMAGGGGGSVRTASAKAPRKDDTLTSAMMSQYA